MITVKAKSLWQGKVGLRDKYILDAIQKGEGIRIDFKGEVMEIAADEVESSIVGRSEKPFTDYFGKHPHYLFYFMWQPSQSQLKMEVG